MTSLSILIPVYNRDCSQLISDLHAQACTLGIPFELIVADDHSTNTEALNAVRGTVSSLEHCRLIALQQNTGRSAIRNLLADNAAYSKLLFMDCDAAVCSPHYLASYIEASGKADVVCGGARHSDTLPRSGVELRWRYEKKADKQRSAEYRSRTPYARFTPFNFLISRNVFQSIRFSTTFKGYGYEDVQFGLELERRGIPILHIDNPLLHLGIEDNATYLYKTEEAILNLQAHQSDIQQGSTLLRHYNRICSLHLQPLLRAAARILLKPIKRNLLGSSPNLRLFAFYKLLFLSIQQS